MLNIVGVMVVSFLGAIGLYVFTAGHGPRFKNTEKTDREEKRRQKTGLQSQLIDYDVYCLSQGEKILYATMAAAALFFVTYVFYHSIIFSLLVMPLGVLYWKFKVREIVEKRKQLLNEQFREALYALSACLHAGKSIEMAIGEAKKDLEIVGQERYGLMLEEMSIIMRKIDLNEPIEHALADFSQRAHLVDIDSFVDVFITTKRTGGNLVEVLKNTIQMISEKNQMKQDIDTLLAQRKFEQKALYFMPIFMMLLLTWSTGSYMEPVFNTWGGRMVVTVALVFFVVAALLAKKIMDIEV